MCGSKGEKALVRVLNGTSLWIPLRESVTIRDIKQHLSDVDIKYEGCKVLKNGRVLRNSQLVSELQAEGSCELTAIPCLKKSVKDDQSRGEDVLDTICAEAANTDTGVVDRNMAKDTLLPGYNLRPNPSPEKKKEKPESSRGTTRNQNEMREMSQSPKAISEGDPGVFVSNSDLFRKFPILPHAMNQLEHTFDIIWNVHAFLTGNVRSSCTLHALRKLVSDDDTHIKGIDALLVLCPCIVVIEHSESCYNREIFHSCLQCSNTCFVDLPYPWKARGEQIPDDFKASRKSAASWHEGPSPTENPQKKIKIGFSRKRLRQCWVLRKCLVNFLLSEYCPRYDTLGLWLFGISEEQVNDDILKATGSMELQDVIAWCKDRSCETNRYMQAIYRRKLEQEKQVNAPPLLLKKSPPCSNSDSLAPENLLDHIKGLGYYNSQIVYEKHIPSREAKLVSLADFEISEALKKYFASNLDITHLYSHQGEAVKCVLTRGKNCIVSTATASGKSLCYLIPIFELLLRNRNSCALLIFPTKALSQDQLRSTRCMSKGIFGPLFEEKVQIYDGDTAYEERSGIISQARILLTNPDMLHCSILPFHDKFSRFLKNLQIIAIDEAHIYRGVFGAHVALVLRRLRRLCTFYGSKPKVVLTTATVSNPKQHASTLIGVDDVELVSTDGSPQQAKAFALWNPPILRNHPEKVAFKSIQHEKARSQVRQARQERHYPSLLGTSTEQKNLWYKSVTLGQAKIKTKKMDHRTNHSASIPSSSANISSKNGIDARMPPRGQWRERLARVETKLKKERRSSPMVEIAFLLSECVKHGLRTIAFCKTRKLAELVGMYTREIVAATSPHLLDSISVYRSGYNATDRREIERRIFNGDLLGTCATNALELGVDIGGLDVTLHLGYQGTVASLWQQAGRAGRRDKQSLSIYVAFDGPLDQYFMSNPGKLFEKTIEAAHIDVSNPQILAAHCACAAHEMPLEYSRDLKAFGPRNFPSVVRGLVECGELSLHPSCSGLLNYSGRDSVPARSITLRDIDRDKYRIIDEMGELIEEIEACKVNFVCYDGAIYMSQGRTYIVKSMDYSSKVAYVGLTDVKYYTTTIDYTDVHLTGGKNMCANDTKASVGYATVTTRWMGYARILRGSGKVFDTVDLFVPDVVYDTVAISQRLSRSYRHNVEKMGYEFRDSLHAAAHAVMNVLPLYIMCNAEDVGTECDNQYDTRYKPERLLLFEKYPGGIGLCENLHPIFHKLILSALELVQSCPCTSPQGCPGCVQSTVCSEYNDVLSKPGSQIILQDMVHDASLI
jgi:ATP-dependent helicase YprA (DUF1998 family)